LRAGTGAATESAESAAVWKRAPKAAFAWLKRRWDAPIVQCARLLPEASPVGTAAIAVLILLGAIIPAATIVATGVMIGSLPATVRAGGLASVAGHRTLTALVIWGALMLLGDAIPRLLGATASSAAMRVENRVQARVMKALSRPWSIAHLEDPRAADLISQVSGLGVGAVGPGQAVAGLVTWRIPNLLRTLASGGLLFAFSWPAATLLFGAQVIYRWRIRHSWVEEAKTLLGTTQAVRRSDYYRELALGPAAAKEARVLDLAPWLSGRLAGEWRSRLTQEWKDRRKELIGSVAAAIFAILAAMMVYGVLAADAARGVITIGALVIYLRSAASISGGGLSNADYAVEYGARSLTALCELEAMAAPAVASPARVPPPDFGLQQALTDRFNALTSAIRRQRDRATWGGAFWLIAGDAVFMAAYVAAISWVVVRAARGEIGLGDVVLTATMAASLVGAIAMVAAVGQMLPTFQLTIERFHWLEDYARESERASASVARPPALLTRGVELEGVSFAYPDRKTPALGDVSLTLPAGGVIALVGENGSGKSTLVKLLCGFYRPTAGRILVDGEDLAAISIDAWRARVSAAFQDYLNLEFLMHESVGVGELKRLGRKDEVCMALERAGGSALAEIQPGGLDTMLGRKWGGTELSGGQWQKLALARAVFRERPLLVVFDEPTAALDASAEHDLFARFAAEARSGDAAGRVTLLVSHRFSTVRMADAIAVLDKGALKEFGSHKSLMTKGGLYAELFELQARAYR
jgi:ABC-type multidrug transport system fused ATPase/permease subunit